MAFFEGFKDKFNTAAKSVKEKTREGIEISKISTEAKNLSARISTLYGELGRKYYFSEGRDADIPVICAQLKELHERYEELDRQRLQLRNQNRCPNCGQAMKQDARFCSGCGERLPEFEPIASDDGGADDDDAPASSTRMHFCVRCGAMLADENAVCPNCSRRDEGAQQPEADEAQNAGSAK